jgi:alcohol dehydrogenase
MGKPTEIARELVLDGPSRLSEVELPVPTIEGDGAVLRVEACGLCGTDHELFSGRLSWSPYGFIPGHETVGIIESIGEAAATRWGVAAGDRVAVEIFQSCRQCPACVRGAYKHCERHGPQELYGFIPVDRAPGLWGGYATHHYLAPDSMLLPIPADIDPVVATMFNPLGAGFKWAVQIADLQAGQSVAILGPGVRGLSGVLAAKHMGAGFVMITGHGPRDADRLATARAFGADLAIDAATDDPIRALHDATGRGADVVVDMTADAPEAFLQAVELAAPGGRVVVAGVHGADRPVSFLPDVVVTKELTIVGTMGMDVDAYRPALEVLAASADRLADLSRMTAGFAGAADLLATMAGIGESGPPPLHGVFVPEA